MTLFAGKTLKRSGLSRSGDTTSSVADVAAADARVISCCRFRSAACLPEGRGAAGHQALLHQAALSRVHRKTGGRFRPVHLFPAMDNSSLGTHKICDVVVSVPHFVFRLLTIALMLTMCLTGNERRSGDEAHTSHIGAHLEKHGALLCVRSKVSFTLYIALCNVTMLLFTRSALVFCVWLLYIRRFKSN